ncbi:MAG: glycosyltransferase family 9 protein [Bryobacterales bacterium]|nr:glycosyltransferase family 9 protein [Bryobacterales bacterium]
MRRLLIRPGALGDFVVSLPALEALRTSYTEVWTAAAHLPLAGFATRARALSSTGLDLLELGLAPPELLRHLATFDSIVSWYGSAREEFRHAVRHLPFTFLPALPEAGSHLPATEFYARQAESLGARLERRVPRIAVPLMQAMPYAAIHPFSGSPRKNWPFERYLALAGQLDLPAAFTAGPDEDLPASLPARRFAGTGELAAWLGNAAYYIGNDSGPTHLAAATGTPTLAIFGPTDPAVWAPPAAIVVRAAPGAADPWPTVEQTLAALVELRRCIDASSCSPPRPPR